MKTHYLATFVALFFYFHTALSIDCHQCAFKDDPTCSDPYDGDDMADNIDGCEDKDTHCSKHKIISLLWDSGFITGKPRETVVTTRGCHRAADPDEGDWCRYVAADGGFMLMCMCTTDGCNSGTHVIPSLTAVFFLMLLALILNIR